jgi:hypothetical protein
MRPTTSPSSVAVAITPARGGLRIAAAEGGVIAWWPGT